MLTLDSILRTTRWRTANGDSAVPLVRDRSPRGAPRPQSHDAHEKPALGEPARVEVSVEEATVERP